MADGFSKGEIRIVESCIHLTNDGCVLTKYILNEYLTKEKISLLGKTDIFVSLFKK